jgi:hypothetical protein
MSAQVAENECGSAGAPVELLRLLEHLIRNGVVAANGGEPGDQICHRLAVRSAARRAGQVCGVRPEQRPELSRAGEVFEQDAR